MDTNEELVQSTRERETDRINSVNSDLYEFKMNDAISIHVVDGLSGKISPINFENLVESDLFVDKSLFIKQVLDSSSTEVIITRPRR